MFLYFLVFLVVSLILSHILSHFIIFFSYWIIVNRTFIVFHFIISPVSPRNLSQISDAPAFSLGPKGPKGCLRALDRIQEVDDFDCLCLHRQLGTFFFWFMGLAWDLGWIAFVTKNSRCVWFFCPRPSNTRSNDDETWIFQRNPGLLDRWPIVEPILMQSRIWAFCLWEFKIKKHKRQVYNLHDQTPESSSCKTPRMCL